MANNVYDAIVIGSGITGGWAAKELTERGPDRVGAYQHEKTFWFNECETEQVDKGWLSRL